MELDSLKLLAVLVVPGLALSGCAGSSSRYPSLSVRDFERTSEEIVEESVISPSPASDDLSQRIGIALSAAQGAHQAFVDAAPAAESIVSAATGMGLEDNAWSAAQIALADLDSRRSATAVALGDLDMLYSEATVEFTERDGIAAARDKVVALLALEDQTLERLYSRLDH